MTNASDEGSSRVTDATHSDAESMSSEQSEVHQEHMKQINQEKKREKLHIPRGKPKSGRIWKEQKTKFSSIIKTRGLQSSLAKKQKLREELKRVKEMSRSIKAEKQAEKNAKRQRRIENLKRTEENRKKSEIVQVITNTAKIKRMKKKQLRMIEKRDTNKT